MTTPRIVSASGCAQWGSSVPIAPTAQHSVERREQDPFFQEIARGRASDAALMETLRSTAATFQQFAEQSMIILRAGCEKVSQLEHELLEIKAKREERKIVHAAEMEALKQREQQYASEIDVCRDALTTVAPTILAVFEEQHRQLLHTLGHHPTITIR